MSLRVRYIDVPLGAQEAAEATADSGQEFGTAQQMIVGAEDTPWVSLEPGGWVLDGTGKLFCDQPAEVGWWSAARTNEDGRFTQPPTLLITFPAPYTATGITFRFWPALQAWCSELSVTWYNGGQILNRVTAYPDDAKWVLDRAVEGFDRIEIQLLATNTPGQFAKLQQIQIGQVVIFLEDELTRVSLLNEIDPSLCELSADTMTVEILEKKDRSLIPQKNQTMELYRDGKQIASHYITDSSRESQRFYTFRCQSAVGRLEDTFLGGIYNGYPLDALLEELLEGFRAQWSGFAGQTVTGYLPVCTRREALQQVAFAIGAVVTTQGDGALRLEALQEDTAAVFDGGNILAGAKVRREAQIAAVRLFAHRYTEGAEEETLLEEEAVKGQDVLYVFSKPHHSYAITGGVLTGSGANWVRITAGGKVTLTGKTYIHSTSVLVQENPLTTGAEKGNVVTVEDATLVHTGNAAQALARLYAYSALRHILTQDAVIGDQNAGQKAESINPWGARILGFITRMESEFTRTGHTANVTIRGEERPIEKAEVLAE